MSGAASYADQLEAIWKNKTESRKGKKSEKVKEGDNDKKDDEKSEKQGKLDNCKSSTRINHAFMKCVKRQFIIQCPDWQQTDVCAALMSFAKSCPIYPMCRLERKKADDKKANKNYKKKG